MRETENERDARVRTAVARAESVAVQYAVAVSVGADDATVQMWSDRFYDALAEGLDIDPCSDVARALALLIAERGYYQAEASRLLDDFKAVLADV